MGFFKRGDLPSLAKSAQYLQMNAKDRISEIPEVELARASIEDKAGLAF